MYLLWYTILYHKRYISKIPYIIVFLYLYHKRYISTLPPPHVIVTSCTFCGTECSSAKRTISTTHDHQGEPPMPRRKGPPDAMTSTYGHKSEHIRVRITTYELDLMSRAIKHGGYESQSQFMRAAIVRLSEQTLNGPTAVERQVLTQQELAAVAPVLTPVYAGPSQMLAYEPPVEEEEAPTLDLLFRTAPQGVTAPDPMEAPLDFDSEGWVG